MKAIILSAGQGRRLLPLTARVPKCTLAVRGKPLLAWQIDTLERGGITDVTVVTGFGADAVEALLAERYGFGRIRTLYNPVLRDDRQPRELLGCTGRDAARFPAAERRHAVRRRRARAVAGRAGASGHARGQLPEPVGSSTQG